MYEFPFMTIFYNQWVLLWWKTSEAIDFSLVSNSGPTWGWNLCLILEDDTAMQIRAPSDRQCYLRLGCKSLRLDSAGGVVKLQRVVLPWTPLLPLSASEVGILWMRHEFYSEIWGSSGLFTFDKFLRVSLKKSEQNDNVGWSMNLLIYSI